MDLRLDEQGGAVFLRVHVVPRSKGESIAGLHGESLRIKVTAPPEKGRANGEVTRLLATVLAARPSEVEIVSGHKGREKRVKISGVTAAAVRAMLRPFIERG